MSDHLAKAKSALEALRDVADDDRVTRVRLLDIITVQAALAQAEALASIADSLRTVE